MLFGDLFVLDSVRLNGIGTQGFLLPLFVIGKVTFKEADITLITVVQNMRCDTVEEPAVMRNHHGTAREFQQGVLQSAQGFNVEIVGGFVK